MELNLPILENIVLSGDEARKEGIHWASRAALRSPEEAHKTIHPCDMEVPEQWIVEAVNDAVTAHTNAIVHSAVKRLNVRTMLNQKKED